MQPEEPQFWEEEEEGGGKPFEGRSFSPPTALFIWLLSWSPSDIQLAEVMRMAHKKECVSAVCIVDSCMGPSAPQADAFTPAAFVQLRTASGVSRF